MSSEKELVQAFGLSHVAFIQDLVAPLEKRFGITGFGCRRFLPDGTSLGVSSSEAWIRHYNTHLVGKTISQYAGEVNSVSLGQEHLFLRTGEAPEGSFLAALNASGIWNGLAIYIRTHESIDGFYFSTTKENTGIVDFYLNHKDLLKLFCIHASQKLRHVLHGPTSHRLYVPTIPRDAYVHAAPLNGPKELEYMLESLQIDDLHLQVGSASVSISFREFQCLFLMSRGQTFKEIGKILDLSPRTIESYINNLRSKTGTSSKSELIKVYFESPYRDLAFEVFEKEYLKEMA